MPLDAEPRVCPACGTRTQLLSSLVQRLDHHRLDRHRLDGLLALPDERLVRALGLGSLDSVRPPATPARLTCPDKITALCRHAKDYPERLLDLAAPPAVLHLAGDPDRALALLAKPVVAIVGSRAPTEYGREVARGLAAALAATGVCVMSGMALGVDAAAHEGALQAAGPTVAILPGGVDIAYPAGKRALHRRLLNRSGAVAELAPGTSPRRWCFVARNRIIAALAQLTIIVEAQERSGALITAAYARDLGRDVAGIPGPITSSRSCGTNALIRDGAHLVRDARDVLDLLYGVGAWPGTPAVAELDQRLALVLEHVRRGRTTAEEVARAGIALSDAQAGLTELELTGHVRRALSGRYLPVVS